MPKSSGRRVRGMKRGVGIPLRLGRAFYDQPCVELAQALLGKVLVRRVPQTGEMVRGRIVETEAYPLPAEEFNIRRSQKNEAMFMDPGTVYVYLTYGMYNMMSVSSQGEGAACLLRGIEPLENYPSMHDSRKKKGRKGEDSKSDAPKKKVLSLWELANGPGKLCSAFQITKANSNKLDLVSSDELWLESDPDPQLIEVESAPRVGIDSAPPLVRLQPYRYFIRNNYSVSTAKPSQIKKRLKESETQTQSSIPSVSESHEGWVK